MQNMSLQKRWWRRYSAMLLAGIMVVYVTAYFAIVQTEPSGVFIFPTDDGPLNMVAVYAIGHETTFGKVTSYEFDLITKPLFYPLNLIDRQLRSHVWVEGDTIGHIEA
jgi:hypothetical protein